LDCNRCHAPLPDNSRFCPSCGAVISLQEQPTTTTIVTPDLENLLREETGNLYDISGELGRGGMAAVFLATERSLGRRVAIKVMPPELTFGREAVERFKREARTSATLDHPNIIPVYRVSESGRLVWYAMKYLQGRSLEVLLRERGPLEIAETVTILEQVGDALDYAHEQGVIHRDVKPANVLLDVRGRAVVTDFGIAKALQGATLTAIGTVLGTPQYMAPEQWASRSVLTGAVDLYACAIMTSQMLTGTLPFTGEDVVELMRAHTTLAPDLERLAGLHGRDVADAVARALAKAPGDRFPSVRAFVAALRIASGITERSEPPGERGHFDTPPGTVPEASASPMPLVPFPPPQRAAIGPVAPTLRPVPLSPPVSFPEPVIPVARIGADDPTVHLEEGARPPHVRLHAVARRSPPSSAPTIHESTTPVGAAADPERPPNPRAEAPVARRMEGDRLRIWISAAIASALLVAYLSWILLRDSAPRPAGSGWTATPIGEGGSPTGGAGHSCVLTAGGGAVCWGDNRFGQLGNSENRRFGVPSAVRIESKLLQIDAGERHTCGVDSLGNVLCWGSNQRFQLGGVTATECVVGRERAPCSSVPVVAATERARAVAAGSDFTCALGLDGLVTCWGSNYRGQLGVPSVPVGSQVAALSGGFRFVAITSGGYHACGLAANGSVQCWGWNESGQLGTRSQSEQCGPTQQTRTACIRMPVPIASQLRFAAVSAGGAHTCGIASDGQAFCWGSNRAGQLGNGTTEDSPVPVSVAGGHLFITISAGAESTCALTRAGEVWCWGSNALGQAGGSSGTMSATPIRVALANPAVSIGSGARHVCAVVRAGAVRCWGSADQGQLGEAAHEATASPVEVRGDARNR
jgi:serine/threonine protein kinase/alpha-tubulin suppressor-like RCC1 family protein